MAEYFYTVASLPMLTLNQAPPISLEYFIEACRYTLKESDFNILTSSVDCKEKGIHPAVDKWLAYDRSLRNELVKLRASKLSKDADRYLQSGDTETGVFDSARDAFNAVNPDVGEEILNAARWRFLDEMEASHPFDLTKLIVYYIKLKIAERRAYMNKKEGEKKYREIYNKIADKIHQSYDGDDNGIK